MKLKRGRRDFWAFGMSKSLAFSIQKIQQWEENITGPADLHFFLPVFVNYSFTDSTVNKPTKLPCVEFPRGAPAFYFSWTLFQDPAGFQLPLALLLQGDQEQDLPLRIGGNRSPSLLVAVNCLQRYSQQLGEFLLGFMQAIS